MLNSEIDNNTYLNKQTLALDMLDAIPMIPQNPS